METRKPETGRCKGGAFSEGDAGEVREKGNSGCRGAQAHSEVMDMRK